jgi:hypothetical protein
MPEIDRHVHFEVFESSFKSWKSLFEEAATFADGVGPERLIGISHFGRRGQGRGHRLVLVRPAERT